MFRLCRGHSLKSLQATKLRPLYTRLNELHTLSRYADLCDVTEINANIVSGDSNALAFDVFAGLHGTT